MDGILERANIPKDATLAFTGERCRIYQWPQEMYDGSIGTFEKIVRLSGAIVIAVVDGKILIEEQEQPGKGPFLCLPGGHVDSWEEPLLEAGKSELKEETGFESTDWELIVDLSQRVFTVFEHHLYLARDCMKVTAPHLDNGEKINVSLVTPEEFRSVIEDPRWHHPDITAYLNKPGNFDKLISLINN